MIETIGKGTWETSCDFCECSETMVGSSYKAMWADAKEEGWRCFKEDDVWKHKCPACMVAGKRKYAAQQEEPPDSAYSEEETGRGCSQNNENYDTGVDLDTDDPFKLDDDPPPVKNEEEIDLDDDDPFREDF